MENGIYLRIGKKIKEIRLEKRITLQNVSVMAGVSKGLLSKIENGRTIPSLPVLLKIIKVLKADISNFFEGVSSDAEYGYFHRKATEYESLQKEDSEGFNYLSVINTSLMHVEFQSAILKLSPGAKREKVVTDGFTFLYLIEGQITYILNKDMINMVTGDSLFFDGRIPHVPENTGTSTAILLIIYLLNT